MAGMLPKKIEDFHKIKGSKISILASLWHAQIIEEMISSACANLKKAEVSEEDITVVWVPGSLEIPLYAAKILSEPKSVDALICFGVVLKGGTTHDQTVLHSVGQGLSQLSISYIVPIINEVIGVVDLNDASSRAYDKGVEAVFAVTEAVHFLKSFS